MPDTTSPKTLTVSELIAHLSDMPPDRPVFAWMPGTYHSVGVPTALIAPGDTPAVLLEISRVNLPLG